MLRVLDDLWGGTSLIEELLIEQSEGGMQNPQCLLGILLGIMGAWLLSAGTQDQEL